MYVGLLNVFTDQRRPSASKITLYRWGVSTDACFQLLGYCGYSGFHRDTLSNAPQVDWLKPNWCR